MSLLPEIAGWKSNTSFLDTAVDRSIILRVLDAGRRAPSAKNRQAWRFVAITEEEKRKQIHEAAYQEPHLIEAPVIIAGCTTNIDYRMPNGQLSYPIDISIALSFMMLQARHEGLETCPVTTFMEQEVKEVLTVPYAMRVVMLLLVGYGNDQSEPRQRLPLEDVISFNHW
ncbi:MAG: nitroreductase family protein [Spirochaetales bacterium]|nr:nitroreductase family protein [Spirochaetales bacterium]MCF7937857.1 nitroreductase family protein [Spirochaetales bacterium]